ncbi:MAG: hypothetical protein KDD22_04565, partial [Bdellovibrionales bacterium]|nr:hypothetical protein [Bdellovibrionales bacterium]
GRLGSSQERRELLAFLTKMLQEASEATAHANEISGNLISAIQDDLAALRKFDVDPSNTFLMRDYQRRIHFLSLSATTHSQFFLFMDPIHQTISKMLESLEMLTLAESAALVRSMGQRSNTATEESSLRDLLEAMDEMDTHLRNLNEAQKIELDSERT